MRILIEQFSGLVKKPSPRMLPNESAQICRNALLDSGRLEALPGLEADSTLALANPRTIFRYIDQYWFEFAGDVDVVPGPLSNDAFDRAYFTGVDYPRITRNDIAVGAPPMPINSYRLGVPIPPKPTLSSLSGAGNAGAEVYETAYVQTFVTPWGEEGPPSDPSDIFAVIPGQTVNLSLGTGPASGNWNLIGGQRRLYRLNTSNGVAEYQLVTDDMEVLYPVETYADGKLSSALGRTLPDDAAEFRLGPPAASDDTYYPSPTGPLIGLTEMPGGVLAGFTGKTICFCEPYLPHYWPLAYRINTHEDIVGIQAVGDGLVVCTNKRPYLVLGSHPGSMSPVKLELRQACVSKRSIVDVGGMVIYASPDGLVGINTGGAQLLTEELFTRKQWQEYAPETIEAYFSEGRYIAFYDTGSTQAGFIFDPRGGLKSFVDIDIHATAGFSDLLDDTLYLVDNDNELFQWQQSATPAAYTWRSKQFVTPAMNMGFLQVSAESYPVTVSVHADGVEIFAESIPDEREVRLPGGFLAERWEVEVKGTATINHILLTDEAEELL